MRAPALLLLLLALSASARGQGAPSSDTFANPTPWPPPEVQVAPAPMLPTLALAVSPERLRSLLAGATPADLLRAFSVLAGRPEVMQSVLAAADPRALANVVAALTQRTQALAVDPAAGVDLDILEAVSRFASLDPRFRDVGNYSFYGRQLHAVRERISAEGMTPEHKAEIIALYRQATEALRAFQAAEAAEQKP